MTAVSEYVSVSLPRVGKGPVYKLLVASLSPAPLPILSSWAVTGVGW